MNRQYLINRVIKKIHAILALLSLYNNEREIEKAPIRILVVVDKNGERRIYKEY